MKKLALITGATGGIGKTAAMALAKSGYDLIIQGRDAAKGKTIADEISKASGSSVKFIQADLSLKSGIKTFAEEVKKQTDKIDVLVQSTGTLNAKRRETKEGMDEGFMVNYFVKFMLDDLLINELKKGEGKIIIVGAPLMKNAKVNFDDLQMKNKYGLFPAMGQAMLCVHLHAQEFAKKNGNHPVINVIHPGLVNTGILRNASGLMKVMFTIFGPLMNNSPEKAIANVMSLATGKEHDGSGYFFPKVAKISVKDKISQDNALAEKLWKVSEEIAK